MNSDLRSASGVKYKLNFEDLEMKRNPASQPATKSEFKSWLRNVVTHTHKHNLKSQKGTGRQGQAEK